MPEIAWSIHLNVPREEVFDFLATDRGRALFWAERTEQSGDSIAFSFPNGQIIDSRVIECAPPRRFALTYFNSSVVTFELAEAGGGTDLHLRETDVAPEDLEENRAGWVSVLLNLKALAEHGVDLRNHDPRRTWDQGFVDN